MSSPEVECDRGGTGSLLGFADAREQTVRVQLSVAHPPGAPVVLNCSKNGDKLSFAAKVVNSKRDGEHFLVVVRLQPIAKETRMRLAVWCHEAAPVL